MDSVFVQGRTIRPQELQWIRDLMVARPDWGRYWLSRHIAEQWNWRNDLGQLKDMAARTLLLKLERRGLLTLPPRQRGGGSRKAVIPDPAQGFLWPEQLIDCPLAHLLPLQIQLVNSSAQREQLRQLLCSYHYLGYRRPVGQNLPYLVFDQQQRPLAALVFGAAAWKCAPRDRFIGWEAWARQAHLDRVANNMRFLILPWVRVKHLASHLLAALARRLSADWQHKYGHSVYLLETFVERARFTGACYRAANWICAGQTQGRSRNDGQRLLQVPRKDVYLYPLHSQFRMLLQKGEAC